MQAVTSGFSAPIMLSAVPMLWPMWRARIWLTFGPRISAACIVAVILNVFFNILLPGTPPEPSTAAAGPAVMVTETEAEVLGKGGGFDAGKPAPEPET